jgi:hypothetical protein
LQVGTPDEVTTWDLASILSFVKISHVLILGKAQQRMGYMRAWNDKDGREKAYQGPRLKIAFGTRAPWSLFF